jgi:hypothetical protein
MLMPMPLIPNGSLRSDTAARVDFLGFMRPPLTGYKVSVLGASMSGHFKGEFM